MSRNRTHNVSDDRHWLHRYLLIQLPYGHIQDDLHCDFDIQNGYHCPWLAVTFSIWSPELHHTKGKHCSFKSNVKFKMAVLVSDMLCHFRLVLYNYYLPSGQTYQKCLSSRGFLRSVFTFLNNFKSTLVDLFCLNERIKMKTKSTECNKDRNFVLRI
jgi:hypothetical protein